MHKTKKKSSKSDKIPKPIKIKKEKSEEDRTLHTMAHYIDDRLELIKQIFGTLKPKTITNLAPEFLKKKSLDEIEETCLNELLCISTKRLRSIIESTKCPTDTESSDDSDVEHKEEHISLEEISSDSEIDGSDKRRVKNKKKKAKKAANKKDENKSNLNAEHDSQISVLELLELQARARAIRSQLALEPVTKIEVDSEEEKKAEKSNDKEKEKQTKHRKNGEDSQQKKIDKERKRKLHEREHSNRNSNTCEVNGLNSSKSNKDSTSTGSVEGTKKIKIKRSYRTIIKEDDQIVEKKPEVEKIDAVKSEVRKSRSPSPDVIPIQAETETLLITDSSDEDRGKVDEHKAKSSEKESVETEQINNVEKPRRISEREDGEVSDTNETNQQNADKDKQPIAESEQIELNMEKINEELIKEAQAEEPASDLIEKNVEATKEDADKPEDKQPLEANTLADSSLNQNSESNDDDDNNDDVISIEGGDLETEMNEQLASEDANIEQAAASSSQQRNDLDDDEDVISLDTSDDDREKSQESNSESWQTRYLKSSKVNQVLAASRLGKRVRDKIKKSNHSKKEEHDRVKKEEAEQKARQQTYTSKHEDGSVEQYKELLELSQRKS